MDIIIGAGITGLSYALFCGHQDYLILEKSDSIGGYCKTTKRHGYVWDYSGHFFHFCNKEIEKLITFGISKEDILNIIKQTKIKYKNLLIDYPFQKNIYQLSKQELIECLYDLFSIDNYDYNNFEEMLYCKFGKSIANKFLIPYNTKLYACDLNTLDKDAMGRFFPYAEKEDIIKNFKRTNNDSYNSSFIYPQNGAIQYINSIYQRLKCSNIKLNCAVQHINLKNKQLVTSNGEIFSYNRIISTIPFPNLLDICRIPYDKSIYSWNKVLVFNLGFQQQGEDTHNHWIYFPENKYCFYRVGFYSNILHQNKLSLYVEIGFAKDALISPNDWLPQVLNDLKKANILSVGNQLIDSEVIIMNPAYVHINNNSIKDVKNKKDILTSNNVFSIGRYGSWTYCSIEDNLIEAQRLASKLNPI